MTHKLKYNARQRADIYRVIAEVISDRNQEAEYNIYNEYICNWLQSGNFGEGSMVICGNPGSLKVVPNKDGYVASKWYGSGASKADLMKDFPEFEEFKPKGQDAEDPWFSDFTPPTSVSNEHRITALLFCEQMCKA